MGVRVAKMIDDHDETTFVSSLSLSVSMLYPTTRLFIAFSLPHSNLLLHVS